MEFFMVDSIFTSNVFAQLIEPKSKLDRLWERYQDMQNYMDELEPGLNDADRARQETAYYALAAKIRTLINDAEHAQGDARSRLGTNVTQKNNTINTKYHFTSPKNIFPVFLENTMNGYH